MEEKERTRLPHVPDINYIIYVVATKPVFLHKLLAVYKSPTPHAAPFPVLCPIFLFRRSHSQHRGMIMLSITSSKVTKTYSTIGKPWRTCCNLMQTKHAFFTCFFLTESDSLQQEVTGNEDLCLSKDSIFHSIHINRPQTLKQGHNKKRRKRRGRRKSRPFQTAL